MLKNLCQIGMDMPRNSWWRWAIGGLLGLLLLTLLTRCGSIQDDIQGRTQGALDGNGMGWATADLQGNGRDVVLSGVAPSEAARDQAINTAQGVYGARVVDHDMSIKQYVSSKFSLSRDGDKVTLSGTLPDQATIDNTVSEVQGLYGADNVTNNLVASDSASAPKWLAGTTAMLAGLAATRSLTVEASDDAVTVSGNVENEALRTQALGLIGDTANASIDVVKTGPSAEELAAIASAEAAKKAAAERLAEQARLAAEEKARLAAEEAARLAAEEEARIALEKARNAAEEAKRLAAERAAAEAKAKADAAAKAEQERLAAIQQRYLKTQTHLSNQARQMVMNCEYDINRLIAANTPPFIKDSAIVHHSGYGLLSLITMQIEICNDLLRHNNLFIDVSSKAIDGESIAEDSGITQKRTETVINYLQHINGVYPGLLRINSKSDDKHTGNTQLHFTITQ